MRRVIEAPEIARSTVRHSADFVDAWRSVACGVYRWRRAGRFAVVPALMGKPVFAYLPGLSYSDLDPVEAQELAREMAGRRFNIRALAPPRREGELPPGSPAVLRVDLAAFGHDREAVWQRGLNRTARKYVQRARRAGLAAAEETGAAAVQAFCAMLRLAHGRHGAPLPPAALFEALMTELDARITVVRNRMDGALRASFLWLRDGPIIWIPWGGAYLSADHPTYLMYWTMVEHAVNEGADILDFGRSPAGSGPYWFKRKYGASPVPVMWLTDKPVDPYRRYRAAQRLWRALPNFVTDRAGPRLCRYLADY